MLTEAGGLATQEVEQIVTRPIELLLSGIPGVERVRSGNSAGYSDIVVAFAWNTEPYHNHQMVSERLAMVQSRLPAGIVPQVAPMARATALACSCRWDLQPHPMALRDYVD